MKTNSPFSIVNETSLERDDVRLVDLRHVLEHDHRPRAGGGRRERGVGLRHGESGGS